MAPRSILLCLAFAFGLAYAIDAILYACYGNLCITGPHSVSPICTTGPPPIEFQLSLAARMFMPMLGVLLTLLLEKKPLIKSLKAYGLKIGRSSTCMKWSLIGLALPYVAYGFGLGLASCLGFGVRNPIAELLGQDELPIGREFLLFLVLISAAIAGLTINAAFALGEEIAWRGLLHDELKARLGLKLTVPMVSVLWALWHAPLVVLFGYDYPHHRDAIGVATFVAICMAFSASMALLKEHSKSVLPPAVMHGTINGLAGLMSLSVAIEDELFSMPMGLLGMASFSLVALIMILWSRKRIAA